MKKSEIARELSKTPNVMATTPLLVQFFHSTFFNKNEENICNHIEDFISFMGDLDKDLIEIRDNPSCFKQGDDYIPRVKSKKELKQIEKDKEDFEKVIKDWEDIWVDYKKEES